MDKLKVLIILLVAITLSLVACGESMALEDTTWVLESYGETGNLKTVLEDNEITATFDSAKSQLTGSGYLNK